MIADAQTPAGAGSGNGRPRRFPVRLALFGATAVAAVAYGFLGHTAAAAGLLIQKYGYPVVAGTFGWWLLAMFWRARGTWRSPLAAMAPRERIELATLVVGLTAVAVGIFPYSYKVLYDELVLQGTAWNLHYFREVGTVVRGYEVEGVFTSLNVYLDKRPYLFAFLVSLIHDLTGYRELNAYFLNTALFPVLLLLFYACARLLTGHRAALAALACFAASPLLAQNANGSGMELLNLSMLLLGTWCAADFLRRPDEMRLTALILTVVLLAQSRYESTLYVGPAALVILEGWRRAGRLILPPAAIVAPLLLIPSALHNTYLSGTPLLWELREDAASRFGLPFLADNLQHALTFLFSFRIVSLNSGWLAVLGSVALGWALLATVRGWRGWKVADPGAIAVVAFGAGAAANLGLLMFYYWGQLDDPIVSRLVLPFYSALGLAIAWALGRLAGRWPRIQWAPVAAAGALLVFLGVGLPAAAHHRTINQLAGEMAWEGRLVDAMPPKQRFVITNKSTLAWLVRRIPVIATNRARIRGVDQAVRVNMENGTFQEVLVFQLLRPTGPDGNFVIDSEDRLPSSYVLEPVTERQIGARILRISRVVEILRTDDVPPGAAVPPPAS